MPAQQEGRKRDLERVNEHRKCLVRLDKPQLAPFTGKNPEKPRESAQGKAERWMESALCCWNPQLLAS